MKLSTLFRAATCALLVVQILGCASTPSAPDASVSDAHREDATADRALSDNTELDTARVDVVEEPFVRDVAPYDATAPDVVRVAVGDRAPVTLEFMGDAEIFTIVPDLDGDGRADLVRSSSARTVVQLGWPARVTTQVAFVRAGTDLVASVGDLNHDGYPDLALSSTWNHEVQVYFGPFDGVSQPISAAFRLARDPMGGIADLFGATTVIDDFTGDNRADLLVAAPSEREEACSGTRSTLVYRGPLAPGVRASAETAADFVLEGRASECLGEHVEVLRDGTRRVLVLSLAMRPGRRGFALPLMGTPTPLSIETTPAFSPGVRVDADGDGMADSVEVDPMSGLYLTRRSSDGAFVDPRFMGERMQQRLLDMNEDGLGVPWMFTERYDEGSRRWQATFVRLPSDARGVVELSTAMPRASGTRDANVSLRETRGDLDGDGIDEIAWGNMLLRHTR
ncbi:MAG: VCBS repeat-containing protein [Myxococcales bacterium]|nr:VCBS repeat-containing protein [Myxococcales bacterium]